jgi:hypothetical protein
MGINTPQGQFVAPRASYKGFFSKATGFTGIDWRSIPSHPWAVISTQTCREESLQRSLDVLEQ